MRATAEQHAELDAEYMAAMDPGNSLMSLYYNVSIQSLWHEEKVYLSRYGQRYGKIVNLGIPLEPSIGTL